MILYTFLSLFFVSCGSNPLFAMDSEEQDTCKLFVIQSGPEVLRIREIPSDPTGLSISLLKKKITRKAKEIENTKEKIQSDLRHLNNTIERFRIDRAAIERRGAAAEKRDWEVEFLNEAIANENEEISTTNETIGKNEVNKLVKSQADIASMATKIEVSRLQIESLYAARVAQDAKIRSQIQEIRVILQKRKEQYDQAAKAVSITEQSGHMQNRINSLSGKCNAMVKKVETTVSEMPKEIEAICVKIIAMNKRINAQNQAIEKNIQDMEALRNAAAKQAEELRHVQSQKSNLEEQIKKLNKKEDVNNNTVQFNTDKGPLEVDFDIVTSGNITFKCAGEPIVINVDELNKDFRRLQTRL